MSDLEKDLLDLIEINESLEKSLGEKGILMRDDFYKRVRAFLKFKDRIKSVVASHSAIEIDHPDARQMLQELSSGKKFIADRVVEIGAEISGEEIDIETIMDHDVLESLVSDELYSWFDPYGYIKELIRIGSMVTGVSVPKILKRFLDDARQCYAFQQYNGVYSLCRTILEASMRDVGLRSGKIQRPANDRDFYKEYPPRKLINSVSRGTLRRRVHDLYSDLSSLIHGYRTVDKDTAKSTLKETLKIVQQLYEKNL